MAKRGVPSNGLAPIEVGNRTKTRNATIVIGDKRQAVPGITAIRSGFARHKNISAVVVRGVTRVSAVS